MFFAGIDAHERYLVVAVVDIQGGEVLSPTRVEMPEGEELLATLAPFRPLAASAFIGVMCRWRVEPGTESPPYPPAHWSTIQSSGS